MKTSNPQVIKLLRDLVRIDSQNPGSGETEIIDFIAKYLAKFGVASRIYEFESGRPNLVCRLQSRHSKKTLLLTPHVDTVPAGQGWKFPPFSGKLHQGKIYGRGATDCKSNVAVAMQVIRNLKEKKAVLENLDLIFAFCADEETGSYYGTIPLVKKLKNIDYGLVLDADEFDIVFAQKGLFHLRVELFGKASHGAFPERGVNAIEKGVRILAAIMDQGFSYQSHPLLVKPTLNVGRFYGGEKVNMVADRAVFDLDIRYLPGMDIKKILRGIEAIIKKQKIKYRTEVLASQEPIEKNTNSFLIRLLMESLRENKIKPKLTASFGATVINFLQDEGIDTFAFGFGSHKNAHVVNECVAIKNLGLGARVLEDYLMRLDRFLADKGEESAR